MALRAAVASGNWSNPAIWNGGLLPTVGDVVASNNFTITIDQNINVDRITNGSTTLFSEVPIMTSNTTPSGIATNSGGSDFDSYGQPFQAFDQTGTLTYAATTKVGQWIAYEFTTPKIIGRFGIAYNGGTYNITYGLEAWDGSTWISIGTHNAVGGSFTSPIFVNTTAYIKYRVIFLTAGVYTQISEVYFYDVFSVAAVAGGGFTINSGVTVTCTNTSNSIAAGSATCLTIASASPNVVTINAVLVFGSQNTAYAIIKTGTCTLNFNGILDGNSNGALNINNNTGTTNIVGAVRKTGGSISSNSILYLGTGNTLNITGNVTGNVTGAGSTKRTFVSGGNSTITITGNLDGSPLNSTNDVVFSIGTNDIVNITGSVTGVLAAFGVCNTIFSNVVHYLKIVGSIIGGAGGPGVYSTSNGAINIFTGPFVSGASGFLPFWVQRMHYQRTLGSYYEFRDNSTNGALPPAGPAPITRLVSPGTAIDAPAASNVRQGVVYAAGSLTGTMVVPAASNVANNVPVDNTVGTAVLDPNAIWAVPLTSVNTLNSIGRRVKNAATVETTGAQLESLIRDNE
jgi:hypothetical protein